MAIVKRGSRVSRVSSQADSQIQSSSSTDDNGSRENDRRPYDEEEEEEINSDAASDSSEVSDIGEKGTELCTVGDQNCNLPYELFDLPDLRPILSLDTWNYCLTDEERFSLSAYLPDMDQQTFVHTLKELLAGRNFHFGSPLFEIFDRLKGGLYQPEVARYREGLDYLQRKEHYHFLRKYQNDMVTNLLEMRGTWENCRNLGIEERIKIWNSLKDRKALAQAESESLSQALTLEYFQKGKSGKPPTQSSKVPNFIEDEKMLEMDHFVLKRNGLTTKFDGRCSLQGMVPSHTGQLELRSGFVGASEEIDKVGKRVPKGVLNTLIKCIPRKNEQTEMQLESDQLAPFSEMQDLGTNSKSLSLHISKQEDNDLVKETSFTVRKTRSRMKIDGLETALDNAKGEQFWDYSKRVAGPVKSDLEHCRKLGRIKEQEISERMGVQVTPNFGKNIKGGNNLAGQKKTSEVSKKRDERANILVDYVRENPQEMPRERASMISSKDLRKYPHERAMLDDSLYSEGQGQNLDKKKRTPIDYHKKRMKQFQEPFHQDICASEQQSLLFGQEMILDGKELDDKKQEIHKKKNGRNDCRKILEQLKRKMEINQSSGDFLRFSAKQSELVETQIYASGITLSLDNSNRSHEGQKKKKKKRQIDDVMIFDLEKKQEESTSLDSPRDSMDTPEGFEGAIKDTGKSETDEIPFPQTEESEDMVKFSDTDTKSVPNLHNVPLTSLCQQSGVGTLLQKKTKKNREENVIVVDVGDSNRSHGDAENTLGKQEEDRPPKNMFKKTSKEDADTLNRVTEMNGLHNNSQLSPSRQVGGLKPLKRGTKKKLEDSKILDGMESNGIQVRHQSTMYLDSDECKAKSRKVNKVNTDSEVLSGVPELNAQQGNDSPSLCQQSDEGKPGKKRVRQKIDDSTGSLPSLSSKQASRVDKLTSDSKGSKKCSPLVMPPVVSSFSFSVIHFLSAVRTAMLSPSAEDISEVVNHSEKSDGERESSNQDCQFTLSCDGKVEEQKSVIPNHPLYNRPGGCEGGSVGNHLERERQDTPYSIPFREIVKRVQMNPGDPCVLEIQEPLQDLVRGALKIFASKTAPQGVKCWKPLAVYDKSTRSWSWIGPISSSSPGHESLEVQTSSEAWGISQKMLLKLVEAFANWLKNGQETLQQIVLLPSPPPPSMPTCLDEKERFRDLRAQKSSITITPSSSDMRAYFRREEVLRYSVPDRAFAYTAADGRKAVVAPLRRCGGKPTSKARDHFMLKPDRPPHVTILCLVRDAAARLPGSIGTRADVCTLIRDSQYIVEDVSDAQVNQVVSGALDRLHYERDPCVQFDGERKLWVYLHTERDEEDFEDDGTSSTKRWKRQKKDNVDNSDLGPCNDNAYHGVDNQDACGSRLGFDFCSSDYNGDSSSIYSGGKAELVYNRNGSLTSPRVLRSFTGSSIEDCTVPFIELPPSIHSLPGSMHESHPMGWQVLGRNPLGYVSNPQSQEHITNKDFDNKPFSRERSIELMSTSLL